MEESGVFLDPHPAWLVLRSLGQVAAIPFAAKLLDEPTLRISSDFLILAQAAQQDMLRSPGALLM